MKFLIILFALGLTAQAHAMIYDDGCDPNQYRCNGKCIHQTTQCSEPGFAQQMVQRGFFQPNPDSPPSACYPACSPDEYCAVFFAGRSTCFPNH